MLTPQLQSSLGSSVRNRSFTGITGLSYRACSGSIIRAAVAHGQSRSFWSCRRGIDYSSHIDPMYHRFTRYRTLKTRAKLLDKLRRRERWEADLSTPFFTSRHIRLASHWNGQGRSRWIRYNENDDANNRKDEASAEEGEYELSRREKEWKEQMEKMRKRIEKDPYEAVFGKRFEPFWSPLVPSWMREEMGLQGWPIVREALSTKTATKTTPEDNGVTRGQRNDKSAEQTVETPVTEAQGKKDTESESNDGAPNGQLTNYSYTSSTSWDSWTRTARREEWDSITGQTRRFEYDPISNRMVQITAPSSAGDTSSTNLRASEPQTKSMITRPVTNVVAKSSEVPVPDSIVNIPVKTSNSGPKPAPVPIKGPIASQKTSIYFPSLLNTSKAPSSPKTEVSSEAAGEDLDSLTADHVRASMGKPNSNRLSQSTDEARAQRHGKADLSRGEWDRAETRVMLDQELRDLSQQKAMLLRQENSLFHIEKQRKTLQKLDSRMAEVTRKIEDIDNIGPFTLPSSSAENLGLIVPSRTLNTTDAVATTQAGARDSGQVAAPHSLQSSLERMQNRGLAEAGELDDSAAHESTGDPLSGKRNNVPKGWETQADTLQSDRILRTRGVNLKPKLRVPRWIDEMNARKAEYEGTKVQEDIVDSKHKARIQRANALLEAEVQDQKVRMQSHENRHAHRIASNKPQAHVSTSAEERYIQKIRNLREELDIAFKQSSVNAEMQVDRIKGLEQELERHKKISSSTTDITSDERNRYVQKIGALRQELDIAFKQSSINAEMQVERIQALERELEEMRTSSNKRETTKTKAVETVRGEGDFCTNVTKYAKDNSKWYKQTAYAPPTASEQKSADKEVEQEVKAIYEEQYGTIDYNHVQPLDGHSKFSPAGTSTAQIFEAESDAGLGKELYKFEDVESYRFNNETLENVIASHEQEAHDAQALPSAESSSKMRHVVAEGLPSVAEPLVSASSINPASQLVSSVEADLPKALEAESSGATEAKAAEWGIEWEEPPLYKVMAYDSGNDMFSMATTSSNFTNKESPISIQQALSQLYQPARFVAHFSELQKDGYQVIYGSKDLLVFKKVKSTSPRAKEVADEATTLQDHGLLSSHNSPRTNVASSMSSAHHGINPVDGMSRLPPDEPSTGSFASPTGFVGDRWEAIESQAGKSATDGAARQAGEHDDGYDIVHYPRVKREERVFTGSRLGQRSREQERRRKRHHHEPRPEQIHEMKSKWKRYRSRMRWVLGAGLGAATVAYAVGAAAERKERKEQERWQEILAGKRTRWE